MADEFEALIYNDTWQFIPRPPGANIVTGKWIYKHKFNSDSTLAHHKACWVDGGFSQWHITKYDETFNPVIKFADIRVILSIAVPHAWLIHQLDILLPASTKIR